MEQEKLLKWGKNGKKGTARETYVANNYIHRGYKVDRTGFDLDVNHKVDLIAWDIFNEKKMLYIQVKGFHDNWKSEKFPELIERALKDGADPIVARVNKSGRIWFWNPIKKKQLSR